MNRAVVFLTAALAAVGGMRPAGQTADLDRKTFDSAREYLRSGDYKNALNLLEEIVTRSPAGTVADDALLELARYRLEIAADLTEAEKTASQLVEKYPSSNAAPDGYIILGRILLARSRAPEDMTTALGHFQRVARVYDRSDAVPEALFYEAETLRLTGKSEEALDRFRSLTASFPASVWTARAHLGIAQCAVALEQPFAAMEALQRVRTRFADRPEAETALNWNTQLYRLYIKSPSQPPYAFARTLGGPAGKIKDVNGLAVGAKDTLFAATRNGVSTFGVDGEPAKPLAPGLARGVVIDRSGRPIVVQRTTLLLPDGKAVSMSGTKADGTPRLIEDPESVVVWTTGEYLIADSSARAVLKAGFDGRAVGVFAPERPDRMVVNGLDEIAMLVRSDKRIAVMSRDGKVLRQVAARSPSFELRKPVDIAFDSLGHLFVLDEGRYTIGVFNPKGKLVASFTTPEKGVGTLRDAKALVVDGMGRLFVYNDSSEQIQVYQ